MLPFYEIQKSDFTVIHNNKELVFSEHMHKYVEILYVFSGVQHITVSNSFFTVNEGEAAIIFPNILHSYYSDSKNAASTLIILLDTSYLDAFFPSLEYIYSENPIIPSDKINDETRFAMEHIDQNSPIEKKLGYTLIIFSELIKYIEVFRRKTMPSKDLMPRLINYISLNYQKPLTREYLAKEFNVSKYHISRIFSEKFNMNLKTYLGKLRTEKAAHLIRTSDLKITAICDLSGFESIRTFNRVFRQNMGMTPSEYSRQVSPTTP